MQLKTPSEPLENSEQASELSPAQKHDPESILPHGEAAVACAARLLVRSILQRERFIRRSLRPS